MAAKKTYELKPLRPESVEAAFEKMRRYRLLNEPEQAESICRDILRVEPESRDAKVGLILCITDQFATKLVDRWKECVSILETLPDEYDRSYYSGIACERRAKAHHRRRTPQSGCLTHTWLEKAMEFYDAAATCRKEGDDAPILRWNTCARMIMKHSEIAPESAEDGGPALLE